MASRRARWRSRSTARWFCATRRHRRARGDRVIRGPPAGSGGMSRGWRRPRRHIADIASPWTDPRHFPSPRATLCSRRDEATAPLSDLDASMRKLVLACVAILAGGLALATVLYRLPLAEAPPLAA